MWVQRGEEKICPLPEMTAIPWVNTWGEKDNNTWRMVWITEAKFYSFTSDKHLSSGKDAIVHR